MEIKRESSNRRRMTGITGSLRKDAPSWILILPSILLFYFLVWRPIGMGFVYSLFKLQNYQPVEFIGLDNFRDVLTDMLFVKTLSNTIKYVLWSFVIGFLPPIILAVMLNEIVHLNGFLKFSIYMPQMVPVVASALIWYFLYLPGNDGILNIILQKCGLPVQDWLQNAKMTIPLIIVSMTWQGCGATMLLYLASLQGINQELYEATKMDGANILSRFVHITLPEMYPIILLSAVRQIIGVFQVMTEPMTMTGGGPNNASLSLNLQSFYYAFRDFQPGKALALGVITFLLLIAVTCFYFRLQKKYEQ